MSVPSIPPPLARSPSDQIHPLYYAFHAVFLTWGTVLLCLTSHTLYKEVSTRGWASTPRNWWLVNLCVTASLFVLFYLDPRTYAGIYDAVWGKFADFFTLICFLQSVSLALFLYLQIVFQHNLARVPKKLTPAWFGFNFVCGVLELISTLVGSIVDRIFWYGVAWVVMVSHELVLLIGLNVCLWQVSRTIIATTQNVPEKISNRNYTATLRKLLYLRILICIVAPPVIAYQIFSPDGAIKRLGSWGRPIPSKNNEQFDFLICFAPLFMCLAQGILIYASRRPDKDSKVNHDRQSALNDSARSDMTSSHIKMMSSQDDSTLKSSSVQLEETTSPDL